MFQKLLHGIGQQVYGVIGIPMERQTQPDAFTSSILFSILGECALALESLHNAEEKEKAAVLAKNEHYNELVIKGEDLNHLHIAGRVVETKAKW